MAKALPGFMHSIKHKLPALSQNTSPTAIDGSQVTTFDYTHGSKEVKGKEPVGMKKLPAKAGAEHMVAGSNTRGDGAQVSKPSRRGK